MRFSLLSLLALAACSVDTTENSAADVEDAAYDRMFAADGEATLKQVDELRTTRVKLDELVGDHHVRMQQYVGGVPVFGGEAIVHAGPDGVVREVTDNLLGLVRVDTTPDYTADDAVELAVAEAGGWSELSDDPTVELWVLRHEGADHLTWRVQLHRVHFDAHDELPVVFVDAHTGEVVWTYDNLQTACAGTTNFYGTVSVDCFASGGTYYLEDTTDLLGTYSWGGGTTSLSYVSTTSGTFATTTSTVNAVEAAYVSQQVFDYYETTHGRTGIDGAGGPAAVTSHGYDFITSTTSYSRNYVNAFWDPTGLYMTYGDGDGVYSGSLTTLDVGGHEMTHGVTQYEANLTYSGEPGGLNESMSDVFGAMVERAVLGETADTWTIGEDTWTPGTAGDALRYMDDPAADGVSYDYYSSSIGSADVHYTSGVGNLAFYLLSEGGTHPRGKSTTVVTGIGADDAADIWYLALSSYMTSSTSYSGARTATLSAAAALFGTSSTQYTQVGNAWTAVGVGGSSTSTCTTATYSGSFSKKGQTAYAPSSSGTSVTVSAQTVALSGPSTANFDVYLEKKSGSRWSTAASGTGSTSTESVSYSGSSGTYRVRVYSKTGSGSYSLSWCK